MTAFAKFLGKEMAASMATKQHGEIRPRIIARVWEE